LGTSADFPHADGDGAREFALTVDSGWREPADMALAFVKRFT
jgi:hypothetical protein